MEWTARSAPRSSAGEHATARGRGVPPFDCRAPCEAGRSPRVPSRYPPGDACVRGAYERERCRRARYCTGRAHRCAQSVLAGATRRSQPTLRHRFRVESERQRGWPTLSTTIRTTAWCRGGLRSQSRAGYTHPSELTSEWPQAQSVFRGRGLSAKHAGQRGDGPNGADPEDQHPLHQFGLGVGDRDLNAC